MPEETSGTVTDTSIIANALSGSLAQVAEDAYDKKAANDIAVDDKSAETETIASEDVKVENTNSADDVEDSDDGYYADEGLEPVTQPQPEAITGDTSSWILNNLPNIQVEGVRGDKPVVLSVKRAEDLPSDFQFTSVRDQTIFQQSLADQTQRAYNLMNQWNQRKQQQEASDFSAKEDRDIQSDIGRLQREGKLKTYKYSPSDPRFNDDLAVKESQEILDFYNQENQTRFNDSQRSGRLYNRLSYYDAFKLYRSDHPAIKEDKQQKQDDLVRKDTTRRSSQSNGQGETPKSQRPKLRRDASVDEIIRAYGI